MNSVFIMPCKIQPAWYRHVITSVNYVKLKHHHYRIRRSAYRTSRTLIWTTYLATLHFTALRGVTFNSWKIRILSSRNSQGSCIFVFVVEWRTVGWAKWPRLRGWGYSTQQLATRTRTFARANYSGRYFTTDRNTDATSSSCLFDTRSSDLFPRTATNSPEIVRSIGAR